MPTKIFYSTALNRENDDVLKVYENQTGYNSLVDIAPICNVHHIAKEWRATTTVRELLDTAKKAKRRRSVVTEYIVEVS